MESGRWDSTQSILNDTFAGLLSKKKGAPQRDALFVFTRWLKLVAGVRMFMKAMMLLAFLALVFLMLHRAGRVIANEVSRATMLFIGIAVGGLLEALTSVLDSFAAFMMLLGIIVEGDQRSVHG